MPATLGYAGSYSVVNQAQGTVTAVPALGQVVSQGQVLYQVNGAPVVLLYGSTPAYRTLSSGLTGADVAELNADLVALGYATSTEIPSGTDDFTYWTEVGVEKLQAALGVTAERHAFPGAGRVRAHRGPGDLGVGHPWCAGPAGPAGAAPRPRRHARSASPWTPAQQSEVAVGDRVTITLPNNQTTPGVISSVGTVASRPDAG